MTRRSKLAAAEERLLPLAVLAGYPGFFKELEEDLPTPD